MDPDLGARPWFRTKTLGLGWTPATWQGWAVTAGFMALIVGSLILVGPTGRSSGPLPWVAGVRHGLGLPAAGLGPAGVMAVILTETGAFLLACWWKSRTLRPLD